jgi:hypothetical protein
MALDLSCKRNSYLPPRITVPWRPGHGRVVALHGDLDPLAGPLRPPPFQGVYTETCQK